MNGRTSLIVFSDDWGRHPSSCQHLVSHLLDDFDVSWINTIGMRRPGLDLTTIHRGLEKMRHWACRPKTVVRAYDRGPQVFNPPMWPSFHRRWERRLNRFLLKRCLRSNIAPSTHRIALTTVPIVSDLIGQLPGTQWIYYCVDDFSQWPGLDRRTLQVMEADLI